MLPNLGFGELVAILVIALLLFGAKRIPEVAKALGKSINAFKSGLRDISQDVDGIKTEIEKLPEQKNT